DADEPIAYHSGAGRRAELLERRLVKGEPGLIAALGDPGRAEVEPPGHCGAAREDEPETSDTIDVRKCVHEGEQAQHTADSRAPEAQEPLLVAGPDGRQGHD